MTGNWDQPGIPHKGWHAVDVVDLGEPAATCEMCRSRTIRYVHRMEHPQYNGQLGVGCVCAENMTEDKVNPRKRERRLQGKARRRVNWFARNWEVSSNGNPILKADGVRVVVFPLKLGRDAGKFRFRINDNSGSRSYQTVEEAKLGAFDAWWQVAHGD